MVFIHPHVLDGFVKNLAIDGAVNDFISDFNKLGQDKTMKDYFEQFTLL